MKRIHSRIIGWITQKDAKLVVISDICICKENRLIKRSMRGLWLVIMAAGLLTCCAVGGINVPKVQSGVQDEVLQDSVGTKPLNDIRFGNWEDGDWLDNDYIRTLRSYLDDFANGKVENEELEPYRELVKGKFVIGSSEPFIAGGLFLKITFLEAPTKVFESWVYSDVDEKTERVTGYVIRGCHLSEDEVEITKEELLQLMQEHPELKAW